MKKGIDYTGITIVFICHDGKGNYLLNKRSDNCRDEHHRWDCGGGALEYGEKVDEALKREIKEEYCTNVLDKEFLGYRDIHKTVNGQKVHWIALDFKVLIDRKKVSIGETSKFEKIDWFTLDNFPKPLHSQFPIFIKKYQNKL